MDINAGVRKLVKLIFGKKPTVPEEMKTHSSIPSNLLNKDFSKRLAKVLDVRREIVIGRWKKFFDSNYREMLISHLTYVTFIMSSCLTENICNANIFDGFISVCVVLSYLSDETLSKVGVDFRDLNPDIFMVFFQNSLRSYFSKRKYFNRFVEYILDHKYLKWSNDSTASASQEWYLELDIYEASDNVPPDMVSEIKVTAECLSHIVLSFTLVILPDLPSEYELIKRLVAYRKREKEKEDEKKRKDETLLTLETSPGEASLNSDSKTNCGEPQEDTAWHESIIKAVIRHNHSKDSGEESANNQVHEKANRILEHLESKIKSLIEVLDKCNE